MTFVLEDIRKRLLERLGAANQKHTEATNEDSRIKEFVSTLSDEVIAKLVRVLRQELDDNRIVKIALEIKDVQLRSQISAIQSHCKHSDYDVDSEGSIELRTCKLCGLSKTIDYRTPRWPMGS